MKKNLLFVLAFIGIASFTYYYEEIGHIEFDKKAAMLFDPAKLGNMIQIKTEKILLYKRDKTFFCGKTGQKADLVILNEFFSFLSKIKVKRYLDKEELEKIDQSILFPKSKKVIDFKFERGALTFVIGVKLQHDQTFYIQVINKGRSQTIIAEVEGVIPGIYAKKDDAHNSDRKYQYLISLLELSEDYFFDRSVYQFSTVDFKKIDRVEIKPVGGETLKIHLSSFETSPLAPNHIAYDKNSFFKYLKQLTYLRSLVIFTTWDKSELEQPLSSLTIIESHSKKLKLKLFSKFRSKKGFFISVEGDSQLYKVQRSFMKLFYVNLQEFWNRAAFSQKQLDQYFEKGIEITFPDKTRLKTVKMPKSLKFNSNKNINRESFKKLYGQLLKGADVVRTFDPLFVTAKLLENSLHFYFAQHEYFIIYNNGELLLVDQQKNLIYSYWVGNISDFPISGSSYLL